MEKQMDILYIIKKISYCKTAIRCLMLNPKVLESQKEKK